MRVSANSTILGLLFSAVCCKAAPLKGDDLAPRDDGVAALNEPCYVHDGACNGYPVCCVTVGTCISKHSGTVSSNKKYYEGGCQSFDSSKKDWSKSPGCTQQGECVPQFLDACMAGTTKPGFMTELPKATMDRFMEGSCETACPKGRRGGGHYSRGGSSNETTTTTTTTTVITRVTDTMYLAISDVSAVNASAMAPLVIRTIAAMAGFGSDHSMLTVEMPSVSETMALTAHFDVSNLHQVKHDEVKANMAAHSPSQVNAMLAMRVGTCSYTVTMSDATTHNDVLSKADGATSDAHGANSIMMVFMAAAAVIVA